MTVQSSFFPDTIWDGSSLKAGTHGHSPTPREWDQAIAEMVRMEQRLKTDLFWDDIRVAAFFTKGSAVPDWVNWKGGLYLLGFSDTAPNEMVFFNVQIPHNWEVGTNLHPHVHWTCPDSAAGKVKWVLEYTIQDVGEVFGDTTSIDQNVPLDGETSVVADTHYITEFAEIVGTDLQESAMLSCRLARDAADTTNDTYASDAFLLEFDLHYQRSSEPGSLLEYGDGY